MKLPSVCPLDCPDTCSLSVEVENGRVVQVRGSEANPLTRSAACHKVSRDFPAWVHGPGRLRTPLRLSGKKGPGAQFERISWDEALDEIHARFSAVIARHGPQAILPLNYAGPHGMLAGGSMDLRFFHRLGASLLDRKPLCGGVRSEAWRGTFGAVPGTPPEQTALSQLVIAWGNQVTVTNLHLAPPILEARRKGARLVVIDPRRTRIAAQADLHLAPRPGTDVVLAFALACALERRGAFDRAFLEKNVLGADELLAQARRFPPEVAAPICGVPVEQLEQLAGWYHEASPAAIAVGNGLERNQNGGAGIRAIFALPALCGKFGVPGGGLVNGASQAFPKTVEKLARPDLVPPGTRTLNILDVGAHLLDPALAPPIEALFLYNHNPLLVHPEQNRLRRGLAREGLFTVGCEVVKTDSLDYCDLVLPAASHFEYADLYPAYGTHQLQRAEPVIPLQHEALPNTEIFRRLAARFGFLERAFQNSDEELMDQAMDPADERLAGLRPSQLPLDRSLPMTVAGAPQLLFASVFPRTPSGKVELASALLERLYGQRVPGYRPVPQAPGELALLSPASDQRITSTFGGLPSGDGVPALQMHPDDAAARGLVDGATVRVFNRLGEVRLRLQITEAVRPGVVSSPKGAWMKTSPNGQTVSALAPATHADLAHGACFNDARVEVAAA
jgi:anaerobic selenocysteine-containing dehydrogenase